MILHFYNDKKFGTVAISFYFFSSELLSHVYIGDVKCDVVCNVGHDVTPYLLTFANRNNTICVALPKVAKASTVKCRSCLQFC